MRVWVTIAGVTGALSVALAAYGAHGLAGDAVAQSLAERASGYGLIHALALLAADRLAAEGRRAAGPAAMLFTAGMALFCGSLAVKAIGGALPLALLTPAGGLALIAGWAILAWTGLRK
ncbi:MAG: DUF423 domain-containing protein [Magnetospirillum sp.]|nr:DUF423 domain-containing protein [Magnetospirillum sp.]